MFATHVFWGWREESDLTLVLVARLQHRDLLHREWQIDGSVCLNLSKGKLLGFFHSVCDIGGSVKLLWNPLFSTRWLHLLLVFLNDPWHAAVLCLGMEGEPSVLWQKII